MRIRMIPQLNSAFAPMSHSDLKKYWEWTDSLPDQLGKYFKLLLITGRRPRELADARWQDFDFENGQWSGEWFKQGHWRPAPISPWSASILGYPDHPSCGPIFAPQGADCFLNHARRCLRSFTASRYVGRRFYLADIRRNVNFQMMALGVQPYDAKVAIGRHPGPFQKHELMEKPGLIAKRSLSVWETALRQLALKSADGEKP